VNAGVGYREWEYEVIKDVGLMDSAIGMTGEAAFRGRRGPTK
jgi:hypothetical protein